MTDDLSVEQASTYLAVSDVTVYAMIRRGELSALGTDPVRLSLADVQALHQARRVDALRALERRRWDPVALAIEVRARLHPQHLPNTNLPGESEREQQFRVSVLSGEARTLFGLAALKAAASTGDGCRWCLSAQFAAADGGWAPTEWAPAFAKLLGAPCETCGPVMYRKEMTRLAAGVHPGGKGPSRPSPPPSREQVRLAAEWAAEHAVTAAARPREDDGGRALVARRRREVQARLTAAKRAGDQKYAIQLRQTLAALTADAARVDGRVVTASARPGKLACGHRLDARCNCPRKASR